MIKTISDMRTQRLANRGCDEKKILKAVDDCIAVMNDLTIDESKVTMQYLNRTLENMYKRSPDTVIGTIQRDKKSENTAKEYNSNTMLGKPFTR